MHKKVRQKNIRDARPSLCAKGSGTKTFKYLK